MKTILEFKDLNEFRMQQRKVSFVLFATTAVKLSK